MIDTDLEFIQAVANRSTVQAPWAALAHKRSKAVYARIRRMRAFANCKPSSAVAQTVFFEAYRLETELWSALVAIDRRGL